MPHTTTITTDSDYITIATTTANSTTTTTTTTTTSTTTATTPPPPPTTTTITVDLFLIISVFFYNGTFRDFFKSGLGFWHLKTGYPISPVTDALTQLELPNSIINWVIECLGYRQHYIISSHRYQR